MQCTTGATSEVRTEQASSSAPNAGTDDTSETSGLIASQVNKRSKERLSMLMLMFTCVDIGMDVVWSLFAHAEETFRPLALDESFHSFQGFWK